jgi:hypothetical protein
MYPETAGRTLEEIDLMFDSGVKAWETHKIHDRFEEQIEQHRKQSIVDDHIGDASHKEEA